MKIEAPQGRYKVVERDRRLVTIDTHSGQQFGAGTGAAPPPGTMVNRPTELLLQDTAPNGARAGEYMTSQAEKVEGPIGSADLLKLLFDMTEIDGGGAIIETKSWFDKKAPRRFFVNSAQLERAKTNIGVLAALIIVTFLVSLFFFGVPVFFIGAVIAFKGLPFAIELAFNSVSPALQEVE